MSLMSPPAWIFSFSCENKSNPKSPSAWSQASTWNISSNAFISGFCSMMFSLLHTAIATRQTSTNPFILNLILLYVFFPIVFNLLYTHYQFTFYSETPFLLLYMDSKCYANQSFVFQPATSQTYTYYQFLFHPDLQLDQLIYTQPDFFTNSDQPIPQSDTLQQKNISYDDQDRNYYSQYFQLLDLSLFKQEQTVRQFYLNLIHQNYISIEKLYYYAKKSKEFDIASGLIYGADFMLYQKGSQEHQHSLYLVHLFQSGPTWGDIFLKVRLANEVKKKPIFVKVSGQLSELKQNVKLELNNIEDQIKEWEQKYSIKIEQELSITNFQ